MLQIQSVCLLPRTKVLRIWRLHHEIPFKIRPIQTTQHQVKPHIWHTQPQQDHNEEDFGEQNDDNQQEQTIRHTPSLVLPASTRLFWSAKELDMAQQATTANGGSASMAAYKHYVDLCFSAKMPARNHDSFKQKIQIIKKHM
ncbi:hypothetical protein DPEC_G00204710 [Dallia pectoralis]|uniref:Uncharacterized protein n=1 Tax=Dallia pectoralis TaxID=75939 RepID=A0ACC2G4E3_DALPE|nr:hypothetical protein DPEC_G00204710 [Dallia pectoralis]